MKDAAGASTDNKDAEYLLKILSTYLSMFMPLACRSYIRALAMPNDNALATIDHL